MSVRLFHFLILIPVSFSYPVLKAQVPIYSNEFLHIGVGARTFGMSNSVVATISDITSTYWNPAGLLNLPYDAEIGLMHSEYFAGIAKYDYGSIGAKIDDKSAAGFSLIRFGVDDIPNTLDLVDSDGNIRYDRISTFSVADYAFLFSYARQSNISGLTFGGNVKIIYRNIGDFANAIGFGFDMGLQYFMNNWQFGLSGKDITSTFNAWSFNTDKLEETFEATGNDLPVNSLELTLPRLLAGAARAFTISERFGLLAEMDADITFDGKRHVLVRSRFINIDPHIGVEFNYIKLIYLRMGFGNIQQVPDFKSGNSYDFQPSIGLGLRLRKFMIDYALTDIADQSIALYSHVFSLKYSFDLSFTKTDSD